ncbi:MAG: hypothetical protein EHJ95_07845 [Methanobacteriota archaeon]|nr:MAG: hypothetical protein EHJ95_07845 [Euryarchaeota archaeon]
MGRVRRRPILRNAAILAAGNLLDRVLGAVYRIALARTAGPEVLGLLQLCLPVLRFSVILGTLGIPMALARVVAAERDGDGSASAVAWALRTVSLVSGCLAVFIAVAAPWGRIAFPDQRVVPLLRLAAPIVFCASLASVMHGVLQGLNRMWAIAGADFLGQLGKLTLGLILIGRAASAGSAAMAQAALAALVVSEAVSCLLLLAVGRRSIRLSGPCSKMEHRLIGTSLPLMGEGLLFALAGTVDMGIIPRRLLQLGLAQREITVLLGQAWGMAWPTVFLPMMVIGPVATAVFPVMAKAAAEADLGELRRRIFGCSSLILLVSIASAIIFSCFPVRFMTLLYACPAAAPYLRSFAWAAPPVFLASAGAQILTALGLSRQLFRFSLASVAVRVFLVYILTGQPRLGITGAALGVAGGNALLAVACYSQIFVYLAKKDPRQSSGGGRRGAGRFFHWICAMALRASSLGFPKIMRPAEVWRTLDTRTSRSTPI